MFSRTVTAAINGIRAEKVVVEADISNGLPVFCMVGYLSSEVREAQDRVRTAIRSLGIVLPVQRITVSLSPSDLRKAGAGFDLPIAAAVLAAAGEIQAESLDGVFMAGELSLDGHLKGIHGILEMVSRAAQFGCHTCVIPAANLQEGSVVDGVRVYGAGSLEEVIAWLNGEGMLQSCSIELEKIRQVQEKEAGLDFADLRGQLVLRRAAEIAVTGFHNLLIIGPPCSGKTMAAKRIPSILPSPGREEILEISRIHSIAGILPENGELMALRPFRAPHHTVTPSGMAGGGKWPRPGEVSLAHRGVLFLDELPEFRPDTLEILRQPMEERQIVISRNAGNFVFPAAFQLVAAMNPCKCGYYPDRNRCRCSSSDVRRYLSSISQPLLDRIDLCVEVREPTFGEISGLEQDEESRKRESSAQIRERVERARKIQEERYAGTGILTNAELTAAQAERFCMLGEAEQKLMSRMYEKMHLTGRAYVKILKVARTIADLEGAETVDCRHLSEAFGYRMIDRKYWGGA